MDIRPSAAAASARSDIVIHPVRPAAQEAPPRVPLEPAVQVDLGGAERGGETRGAEAESRTRSQFARDPQTEAIVYQVIDPVSGEVFVQLPDEATLRARIYARELEARAHAESTGSTVAIA